MGSLCGAILWASLCDANKIFNNAWHGIYWNGVNHVGLNISSWKIFLFQAKDMVVQPIKMQQQQLAFIAIFNFPRIICFTKSEPRLDHWRKSYAIIENRKENLSIIKHGQSQSIPNFSEGPSEHDRVSNTTLLGIIKSSLQNFWES